MRDATTQTVIELAGADAGRAPAPLRPTKATAKATKTV